MPLFPYIDEENAPEKTKEILKTAKERFRSRVGDLAEGLLLNSHRLLAHRPEILEGFLAFGRSVLDQGILDPPLKRLAILKTSLTNGCAY